MAIFPGELRQQWPLVAVCFLMKFFAFGFPTFALPFVYDGAIEEFGWSRQQAVLLASFKFYTSALAALLIGRMLDWVNPKYAVAASAAVGAVGMAGFLMADTLPVYYALGVVLGINAAAMAISVNVIVCRAFEKSTGAALGIVLAGTSAAGMVLPLLMAPLMAGVGWRATMAILSCGIWLVALPAWFLLFRDGALAERLMNASFSAKRAGIGPHFRSLAATRHFWFIIVGLFLVSAVHQAVLQNQVLFLKLEKGLSLETVALGASLLAALGIAASVLSGGVYDRFSISGIVASYALLAVSVGMSFAVGGVTTMLLFMAVRGLAHGALMAGSPVLLKHYYGPENLGLNMGIMTLCASIGFGFGPPLMASMADRTGSYGGAFAMGTAAILVAAALLCPVKPRFWQRRLAPGAAPRVFAEASRRSSGSAQ